MFKDISGTGREEIRGELGDAVRSSSLHAVPIIVKIISYLRQWQNEQNIEN
jgi:hypothetical protein